MPRHDHEPKAWVLLRQSVEGIESQLLLGSLGAAGEKHHIVIAEARQLTQSHHLRCPSIPLHTIELHRAGHDHVAASRRRERGEAVGILLRPRDHERYFSEHSAYERANPTIALRACLAHPGVGHHDRDAAGMGARQQVWPKLQFAQHEQIRTHAVEHAVHRPGEVEGAGKGVVDTKTFGGDVEARRRGAGNDTVNRPAGRGCLPANLGGQHGEQLHLADAHAVKPDA